MVEREKLPNGKLQRSKLVGVESGSARETPQPETEKKQAGWVENDRTGETPQLEAKRNSAQ